MCSFALFFLETCPLESSLLVLPYGRASSQAHCAQHHPASPFHFFGAEPLLSQIPDLPFPLLLLFGWDIYLLVLVSTYYYCIVVFVTKLYW